MSEAWDVLAVDDEPVVCDSIRALAAGATDFLAKPLDDVELLKLTRHALAQADGAGEEGRT